MTGVPLTEKRTKNPIKSLFKPCYWVPEGNLAGILGGAFLRSGRSREPGKAFKKVGGFAPRILEGLPGHLGPARPQNATKNSDQTALRYPVYKTLLNPY